MAQSLISVSGSLGDTEIAQLRHFANSAVLAGYGDAEVSTCVAEAIAGLPTRDDSTADRPQSATAPPVPRRPSAAAATPSELFVDPVRGPAGTAAERDAKRTGAPTPPSMQPAWQAPVEMSREGLKGYLGALAVDSSGTLYTTVWVDWGRDRVFALERGAERWRTLPFTRLKYPSGVAVDASGTVYVAKRGGIVKLATGSTQEQAVLTGGGVYPWGVAVDSSGGLYVADHIRNRVFRVAPGPTTQLSFTGLKDPRGVAVDAEGAVYVVDTGNCRVLKLDAGSDTQQVLPFLGLQEPQDLAVDTAGTAYVSDRKTGIVKMLVATPAGPYTQHVLPFPRLYGPKGVAVDRAGTVYVAGVSGVSALAPR